MTDKGKLKSISCKPIKWGSLTGYKIELDFIYKKEGVNCLYFSKALITPDSDASVVSELLMELAREIKRQPALVFKNKLEKTRVKRVSK